MAIAPMNWAYQLAIQAGVPRVWFDEWWEIVQDYPYSENHYDLLDSACAAANIVAERHNVIE